MQDNFANEVNEPCLIILDDLLNDAYSGEVCRLFTKGSHHRNVSIILITQNLFHQAKYCRDISLNAKYIVLIKNARDKNQFTNLARQVYPEVCTSRIWRQLKNRTVTSCYTLRRIRTTGYGFEPTYSRTMGHPHSIFPRPMRRIKANYHTLQVLENARPKLCKAIVSNCNKDLLHSISECVLNVLNGNIHVSDCAKRILEKYNCSLRSLVDRRLPLASRKRVIIQRGGFLLPVLSAVLPTLVCCSEHRQVTMTLRMM